MKKLIGLLLASAMVLSLAACTGKPTNSPNSSENSSGGSSDVSSRAENNNTGDETAAAIKPEGYPKGGTITVVCGFNAGGAQDNNCRVAAQYASILSGDNYVVTNIAGSSGRVAAADVTASPADGLKIYLANLTLADPDDYQYVEKESLAAQMTTNLLVAEDFDAICAMHDDARSITIRADDDRFSTWEEFETYMLEHPGELAIGTPGANGAGGLMSTLMEKKLGYEFNVVHYTSTNEVHAALLGGHVDAEMSAVSAASSDGDLAKTIAVASEKRIELSPDVPTFQELGVDLSIPTTRCFFVKKGTDPAIISYLSRLFGEMAEYPDYVNDNHTIYATTVDYQPAEQIQELINETYAVCSELLK